MDAAWVEILKLLLQAYFAMVKKANLTEEEAAVYYEEVKKKFEENDPDKLPDL